MQLIDCYWICPKCKEKVFPFQQTDDLFFENGEAQFDAMFGIDFHSIVCTNCGAEWLVSLTGVS